MVRFSSDGRVFVAEKRGVIKVFDSLTDTNPTVFADLNVNVHNFWDRGLLGMALAPNFPADPSVYVLYTYDHELGSTAPPALGNAEGVSDPCPTPPGATADGCVVSGRLSKLQASGNVMTGSRAGAHRGLVPAVPAIRSVRWSSAVMAPCTPVGATAPASTLPTMARTDLHSTPVVTRPAPRARR